MRSFRRELDAKAVVGLGGCGCDGCQGEEGCGAVDVALDDVASEGGAGGGGEFEVEDGVGTKVGEGGSGDGLGGEVGGEAWGKALGSILRAVRQTPLTAMLSPVLKAGRVRVGEAMVMRVAPSVGVMARRVPVVSMRPVNIDTGYSCPFSELSGLRVRWPGVVEIAGDAGVWTVGRSGDAVKGLLEEVGGGDALGEGEGLFA